MLAVPVTVLLGWHLYYQHKEDQELAREHERYVELEERRASRAQSFEWSDGDQGGMVLTIRPGMNPLPTLTAPPAPRRGAAMIRGEPGAAPANAYVMIRGNGETSQALATEDGRFEASVDVSAGEVLTISQRVLRSGNSGRPPPVQIPTP